MNYQRKTIVNTALSNRPAATVISAAALAGGLYYLFCLLRLPGEYSPYAGVILSAQDFTVLDALSLGVKIAIKAFLIAALLYACSHTRHYPYTRTPARLWVCSLSLEIVLYVLEIFQSLIEALSERILSSAGVDFPALLQEVVPSVLSILTFALLIVIALRSSDVLNAAKYFRFAKVTTMLAVLFLIVHLAGLVSALRSGVGSAAQEAILLADGLTVLLPSILLMRAAGAEKKVNYTSRRFYMGQRYER